ncbi:hypothetical protein ACQCN2_19605 [Brevibacillus ginsengisoli]|uniref:hypothetical protein n=1 Tax=Brevibacillus ginsengisoli TaxID=363854 RepID=UPI003CFBA26E
MKRIRLIISFVMTLALGWNGLSPSSAYANNNSTTNNVQSQSSVEHMQTLVIDPKDGLDNTIDEWYDSTTGDTRIDRYSLSNNGLASYERTIHHEGHYYLISLKAGKLEGTSLSVKQSKPYKSLFEDTISTYKQEWWKPIGTVQLDGKKVNKLRSDVNPKPQTKTYRIAYIDASTSLPIKVEEYGGDNQMSMTYVYYFNRVNDPNGQIFKDFAGVSIKKKK